MVKIAHLFNTITLATLASAHGGFMSFDGTAITRPSDWPSGAAQPTGHHGHGKGKKEHKFPNDGVSSGGVAAPSSGAGDDQDQTIEVTQTVVATSVAGNEKRAEPTEGGDWPSGRPSDFPSFASGAQEHWPGATGGFGKGKGGKKFHGTGGQGPHPTGAWSAKDGPSGFMTIQTKDGGPSIPVASNSATQ